MRRTPRSGFTIVELLVSLSVIALLLAITIPAIQTVRESSRKIQCEARLKQFGVALQAFEATHGSFPEAQRAALVDPNTYVYSAHYYAPHVYLLPFMDQTALSNAIDTQQENSYVWDPSLLPAIARTPVESFLCPSDSGSSGNNYRFCLGIYECWTKSSLTPGPDGPFQMINPRRAADIKDGMSNTVALSEKRKSSGGTARFDREEDFWWTGILNVVSVLPPVDDMVELCGSLASEPPEYQPHVGGTWFIAAPDYTWYNHAVVPNHPAPDCSAQSFHAISWAGDGVYRASSHHTGGVNCVFLDGHTKFISNSIDLRVWRGLATRDGAEKLGDF